jgi:Protein of unknown function (DUF1569)
MPDATTPQRRKIRFQTVDEAIREAERLAQAEREGRLARAGNWSLGRTLGHLATWANFAHDGYPPEVCPPLPIRLVIRLMRGRILRDGMSPGMRIGRMPEGTLGLDDLPTEEGLNRYRAALRRLAASAPSGASPVFGKLTHDQWIQLNLRHAELHLGFQVPTAR